MHKASGKLLIFAHVPPPVHGQAIMVEHLLAGLETASNLEVHHIDARVSDEINEVGGISPAKILRFIGYCLKAIGLRLRHGIRTVYYIPAPAKRSAILRDLLFLILVKPFFPRVVLHWHAIGLGQWATAGDNSDSNNELSNLTPIRLNQPLFGSCEAIVRALIRCLYREVSLSIVLTSNNQADAQLLRPAKLEVIANGIPDPCPDAMQTVIPQRQTRIANLLSQNSSGQDSADSNAQFYRVLFIGHCTEEKGFFDAIHAVTEANRLLAERSISIADQMILQGTRISLSLCGKFMDSASEEKYSRVMGALPHFFAENISFTGHLNPQEKFNNWCNHDCLINPSHWESFGLTVVEAMAFGMPVVTSNQVNLVALVPERLRLSAPVGEHAALAQQLIASITFTGQQQLRDHFLNNFTIASYHQAINAALTKVAS